MNAQADMNLSWTHMSESKVSAVAGQMPRLTN